eukprot:82825-Amphidinium_carterae.1
MTNFGCLKQFWTLREVPLAITRLKPFEGGWRYCLSIYSMPAGGPGKLCRISVDNSWKEESSNSDR